MCFKPAEISGGEFFIADGKRIFRDIDSNVLDRIYRERVRISVSNLDFFAPIVEDRGNPKLEKTLKDGIAKVVDKYDTATGGGFGETKIINRAMF